MASIARQSLLRQTFAATPNKQLISRNTATLANSTSTSRPLAQLPARSSILRNAMPVAAFHASGRKAILPPLPRMAISHQS